MVNILVVTPDEKIVSAISLKLAPHADILRMHVASSRQEAMVALQHSAFQLIVSSLKIPGVSDGYRLLAHLVKSGIARKKIVVLVDEKSEKVQSGIAAYGIENLQTMLELDTVVTIVLKNAGVANPTPSSSAQPVHIPSSPAMEEIRNALSVVMGPVGSFIFQKAASQWKNIDNIQDLIETIAGEIGEKEQIGQFYRLLNSTAQ